ncbi:MAG: hypothetical protein WAL87_04365 [Chthoniobacterales bacterium]
MLPDGKGGYSVIAPIKKNLIAQSLWIPPVSGNRPKLIAKNVLAAPASIPTTPTEPASTGTPVQ